jgi:formimidoylglutamate deiminase
MNAMERQTIVEADLTWLDDAFEPNVQIVVGANGLIQQVGFLDLQPSIRLRGRALLPGMVNAHSHAFHRGLRGIDEKFASGGDTLWSWRESMHELVACLKAEEFKNICRVVFEEMLHHGITAVGEFQYLHHDASNRGYAFDDLVLEAARETGIRIVLICGYYAHGGIGKPLNQVQKRFASSGVDEFLKHVERLRERVDGVTQRVAISAHSMRAATPDEVAQLAAYAKSHDMPFHMHAESQRHEIQECREAYGASPVELLLQKGLLTENVTLVHCTRSSPETLRAVAEAGASVCLCPMTEASLCKGFADVPTLVGCDARIGLGTDSNMRVSMNEQMRWLEYTQRARHERRGVCVDRHGRSANALWGYATIGGARSLGLPAGRIASSHAADFIAIDTQGLTLLGATPETLLGAFVFGGDRPAITHTCVGGTWHEWGA